MSLKTLLDLHLSEGQEYYVNTAEETELLNKFEELYSISKSARDKDYKANPANLDKWRKAYEGLLKGLNYETQQETDIRFKSLRKIGFELIEAQVNNSIPGPKMKVKYKKDIPNVRTTEGYLKYLMDKALTERVNDRSERSRKVDGTFFYKIVLEKNGELGFKGYLVDQIIPQPGIINFYDCKYVFVEETVSLMELKQLYNRNIMPSQGRETDTGTSLTTADIVSCYYINEKGLVGLFIWAKTSSQVIFNEYDWQVRKYRTCNKCGEVVISDLECPVCGNKSFSYKNAKTEILEEDVVERYNPYEVGETGNEEQNKEVVKVVAPAGTEVPYYQVRRLPFVISTNVSSMRSMYGVSDMSIILEMQDSANKILTRVEEKLLSSSAMEFTPAKMNITDDNKVIKKVKVKTYQERQMSGLENYTIDIRDDLVYVNNIYESARASLGITESYQGKRDTSAESGKAKEIAASQSAGRLQSKDIMKSTSYSELYELLFQYSLAFSNKSATFVKTNADGQEVEEEWNKHMFLDTDDYGNLYYRDDFAFSVDETSALTKDRPTMWQLIKQDFINGSLGNPSDPRAIRLFWNLLNEQQYPIADNALAAVKESEQHLPFEVEQMIMNNPEAMQLIMSMMQEQGSGRSPGQPQKRGDVGSVTGATHAKNMEKTNERNRMNAGGV